MGGAALLGLRSVAVSCVVCLMASNRSTCCSTAAIALERCDGLARSRTSLKRCDSTAHWVALLQTAPQTRCDGVHCSHSHACTLTHACDNATPAEDCKLDSCVIELASVLQDASSALLAAIAFWAPSGAERQPRNTNSTRQQRGRALAASELLQTPQRGVDRLASKIT